MNNMIKQISTSNSNEATTTTTINDKDKKNKKIIDEENPQKSDEYVDYDDEKI